MSFYTPFISNNSTSSSSSSSINQLSVTGLEPNIAMWGYAQQAAAAAGLQQQQLQLVEGDAQQMPFDSSSFDAAVMTLVSEAWQQAVTPPLVLLEGVSNM
jgi:ubiquinone/menaquinone biosynthesis C-methylase UbiE